MKKTWYIFLSILLPGILLSTSCTKTSDPEPVDLAPAMSFVAETGYVSGDATLKVDSAFDVKISASSNSNSKATLVNFSVTRIFNGFDTTFNNPINVNVMNMIVHGQAINQVGQEQWKFKVTDAQNNSREIGFTITTVANKSTGLSSYVSKIIKTNTTASRCSIVSAD
jgi:hypothetical protein